jgi:hypothetical protein
MKDKMERPMTPSDYLELREYCIALPGVASEDMFIKAISHCSTSRSASILSFILVLVEGWEVMCL